MSLLKKNGILKAYKGQRSEGENGEALPVEGAKNESGAPPKKNDAQKDMSQMFKSKSRDRAPKQPEADESSAPVPPQKVEEDEFPQLDDMGDNVSYTSVSASMISKVDQTVPENTVSSKHLKEVFDPAPPRSNISVSSSSSASSCPTKGSNHTKVPAREAAQGQSNQCMFEDDECSCHVATPRVDALNEQETKMVDLNSCPDCGDALSEERTNESEFSHSRRAASVPVHSPTAQKREETQLTDEWDAANAAYTEQVKDDNAMMAQLLPINFWEALILLRQNKSAWPKVAQPEKPKPAATETLKPKKKSLFSCCDSSSTVTDKARAGKAAETAPARPLLDRDITFFEALRKMPLDVTDVTHARILYTVYHLITSVSGGSYVSQAKTVEPWWQRQFNRGRMPSVLITECNNAGEAEKQENGGAPKALPTSVRWEEVGFQGNNPATDLRGSGMLALLTMLYLLDYYPLLSQKIWALCHPPINLADSKTKREIKEIPFVLIGFNVTGVVMDAYKHGFLKKSIDQITRGDDTKSVVDIEAEKSEEALKSSCNRVAASPTPCYCKPTASELAQRKKSPLLFAMCDYFVGTMEMFLEVWRKKAKAMAPSVPTVAEFNSVLKTVKQSVMMPNAEDLVAKGAAKARFEVMLEETIPTE
ncbi:hypothetical protein AGDE_15513 [Angomonas deanei]|uniref:ELMO/CED-12 family, putative n=1 Tax=Angomonas deanei TaxID=59799 RepID=A0A7G2C3H2_9TRYP|nr:hypothetical protein AGDE_15513 [Angomonas deanei]CAD2214256.1 ELMO/CED-12 family, putative [Angomonas deanei]|eukprot:EPY18939.1 hypothetical protein AGDE_15513 [Angomonas deanei]